MPSYSAYSDCPRVLRDFLSYHETIRGQSAKTIAEYHLDLRMFLRFMKLMHDDMPYDTDLDSIDIRNCDIAFIRQITTTQIYDYLTYLANDRVKFPDTASEHAGIGAAARARKLSAIKSFYKYLTVRTKQLDENPVADLEYPKLRRSLPKFLTLEQSIRLLRSIDGLYPKRDYAILCIFLNCGLRISELTGLNLSDATGDQLRVLGKGNKERFVYMSDACREALDDYIHHERNTDGMKDPRPLFISRDHNRMSTSAVHRMVKKHLFAAGIDPAQYSAHKLRHTAATMMLQGGVDVRTVQEVLGHENLNTTQIYTHIESAELRIAADASPLAQAMKPDKESDA